MIQIISTLQIKMPNYSEGKIYAIKSQSTSYIYIGATTRALECRFYEHVRSRDCSSKKITLLGDAYIELIENFPCLSKHELYNRETEIIISTPNCINKQLRHSFKNITQPPSSCHASL